MLNTPRAHQRVAHNGDDGPPLATALPDQGRQAVLAGGNGPGFTATVPDNGYRWWYLDAFSPDHRFGLTIIAFIGSVFSPYYAAARRRGPAAAEQYCSLNAILYGPRSKHWTMTERGSSALARSDTVLQIGPSSLRWEDGVLDIAIEEITVPLPRRLRGRVRVEMPAPGATCYALDAAAQHRWWPIAPSARVSVRMDRPDLDWDGRGYIDCNAGSVPLESTFHGWDWCRVAHPDGDCTVLYDTRPRSGQGEQLALHFNNRGPSAIPVPPPASLAATPVWRVGRGTRADSNNAVVLRTFEDTPFYARSLVQLNLGGEQRLAMHESLDLDRFSRRWVQTLLPFRMPRRA